MSVAMLPSKGSTRSSLFKDGHQPGSLSPSLAVLLNFGVGLGHMPKTGDVSTTWMIASYDVAGLL